VSGQMSSGPRFSSRYWLPVILFAVSSFWMSTENVSHLERTFHWVRSRYKFFWSLDFQAKKWTSIRYHHQEGFAHVVEYLILGFLLFRAFPWPLQWAWWSWRMVLSLQPIVVLLWAASDEFPKIPWSQPERLLLWMLGKIISGWNPWSVW